MILHFSLLTLIFANGLAHAKVEKLSREGGNKFGIGIGFSETTGISLYADTSSRNFVQGSLGFARYGTYIATADYAFPYRNVISAIPRLTPFWGLGAVLLHDENRFWTKYPGGELDDKTSFVGARIPLGLEYVIPGTPVQLAGELAPSFLLIPEKFGYLQGGMSARVLF